MDNRFRVGCLFLGLVLIYGCWAKHQEFHAKFEKETCTIVFPDSLNFQEITITQPTMSYDSKYELINKNSWITSFNVCKIDTTVFNIIRPDEHARFKPEEPFNLFIRLNRRNEEKYQSSYYHAFFDKGVVNADTKILFDGIKHSLK